MVLSYKMSSLDMKKNEVLHGVSLNIKEGTTVAFVGQVVVESQLWQN